MDIASIMNIVLVAVFCLVGVALIVFLIELIKILKTARGTVESLGPTLKNVEDMTSELKPALAKVDPLMERVQITVDSLNLEMMRLDGILENVSEITDNASSATAAVDNITNVPLKAVNSVAERVRNAFGAKGASEESAQLAEQRVAVAQALEDYKAAEKKGAKKGGAKKAEAAEQVAEASVVSDPEPDSSDDKPKSYVKETNDGSELVIDPKVISESSFFDEGPDAK